MVIATVPIAVTCMPALRVKLRTPHPERIQLHILTKPLYTLMVVMALVTTAMSGPLLKAIYPNRVMQHDLAAADRASTKAARRTGSWS